MILRATCAAWLMTAGMALAETPDTYSADTPVEKLASDPAAAAVLNKDLPGLLTDAAFPLFKSMSLKQLQSASGGDLSEADMNKAVADLQALQQQQHASLPLQATAPGRSALPPQTALPTTQSALPGQSAMPGQTAMPTQSAMPDQTAMPTQSPGLQAPPAQ